MTKYALADASDPNAQPCWRDAGRVYKLINKTERRVISRLGGVLARLQRDQEHKCVVVPTKVPPEDQANVRSGAPSRAWQTCEEEAFSMPWAGQDLWGQKLTGAQKKRWFKWLLAFAAWMDKHNIEDTDSKPENFTFNPSTNTFHCIDVGGMAMAGDPQQQRRVVSYTRHIRMNRREAMQRSRVIAACWVLELDKGYIDSNYDDARYEGLVRKLRACAKEMGVEQQAVETLDL